MPARFASYSVAAALLIRRSPPSDPAAMPGTLPELFADASAGPVVSIEVFPPKTEAGDDALRETLTELMPYDPAFVSCTYGAGGSTRTRTLDLCEQLGREFNVPMTAHFTCVGSSRAELVDWLREAARRGVANIMALRGDAPDDDGFQIAEDGLGYAAELVELIRSEVDEFGIGVAGYPETHPEACDADSDLSFLKAKCDRGADAIFTQLFYDNDLFYAWRDRCTAAGIEQPIVPGVMPITNYARIQRITKMCGAKFPDSLASKLEAARDDDLAQMEIGCEFAIRQCRDLLDAGVPGIHFYALNKSRACATILDALGLSPAVA